MPTYFVDTWFWIALIDERDTHHSGAEALSNQLIQTDTIVTTEMVFTELLGYFSDENPFMRIAAAELIDELRAAPNITIVGQFHDQFTRAVEHYRKFADKNWSLTDCNSMLIMIEKNIQTALTNDHRFEQAGFVIRNC